MIWPHGSARFTNERKVDIWRMAKKWDLISPIARALKKLSRKWRAPKLFHLSSRGPFCHLSCPEIELNLQPVALAEYYLSGIFHRCGVGFKNNYYTLKWLFSAEYFSYCRCSHNNGGESEKIEGSWRVRNSRGAEQPSELAGAVILRETKLFHLNFAVDFPNGIFLIAEKQF